ncbi:MFS transporter [Actinoalloteichus hymeniacidonis]|uniref:Arabinose efflux permease family protein n=1 Tax=Actinoalloteichus hymeniacidonis TaxID=340345 RepID=A0AAC9HNT1_9PSEU|nr:MFS transporter [Actinoalloteichus hymeniacidonis]AOS62628.1 arabinose efflux permease family protein [Actinoalloteichus hymeniacidonis]MBB5909340.1 putative MFS family arabinose efflux permease [Actinoalloteichus hymeniacidonis]
MPAWLFALLATAFVFYTDDYVIAGVLPELAAELAVSNAQAGQLVTVFSLTVAVAAPIAGVVLARVPRRRLFAIALPVFALANLLAAIVPTYEVLLLLRVLAALAAAASTPASFALAAALAPPERVGRYIAVVALGVTGATALGVPIGTWIGGALGWRATFATMAVLGIGALVFLLATLPKTTVDTEPTPLRAQFRVLSAPAVSLGLLANTALMTGSMMFLTYLAPFLGEVATTDITVRGALFALSGIAGMIGIWAGGLATDRWGSDRTLTIGVGAFLLAMAVLWAAWLLRPVGLPVILLPGIVWGAAAFWNSPAVAARLHRLAGPVAPQALAWNTSATYLGVAAGGVVGGILLTTVGTGALPVAAAGFGAIAFVLFWWAARFPRPTVDA